MFWSDAFERDPSEQTERLKHATDQAREVMHETFANLGVMLDIVRSTDGLKTFKTAIKDKADASVPQQKQLLDHIATFNPVQFQKIEGLQNTCSCQHCFVAAPRGEVEGMQHYCKIESPLEPGSYLQNSGHKSHLEG